MQGVIRSNEGVCTSRSLLRIALLAPFLISLSGCSGIETFKNTLRAASNTMVRIANLSLQFEEGDTGERLEEVEDRVLYACQNLFDSADYRFRRENIPWVTRIGVVFTADECQSAVDQAQPNLEYLQNRAPDTPI